ncbi:MAG: hypothetical protein A3J76_01330 [Candidatus Moranbacteria bacterium RBG_13_45_13]|nr:MAG: hypothetical protein A3J76_01330 [Candidatus Moranbacteria bacterium RBG_13_45_13]
MKLEKGPPLPGQDALEQKESPDQGLVEKIQQIVAEAQVKLKESDVVEIVDEIAQKKRLAEARKKDSGQEQEFSEEGFIQQRVEAIKEGEEFLKTYLDALGVFKEICPDGKFHPFDINNPRKSLSYAQRKEGKEEGKYFFSTIARRLKNLRDTFGAPIEKGTRCFIVSDFHGDAPSVKGRAINKIDENGRVRLVGKHGTYNQKIYKSAEDAIRAIRKERPADEKLKEIKVERLPD